jgi:hypothetical protein
MTCTTIFSGYRETMNHLPGSAQYALNLAPRSYNAK